MVKVHFSSVKRFGTNLLSIRYKYQNSVLGQSCTESQYLIFSWQRFNASNFSSNSIPTSGRTHMYLCVILQVLKRHQNMAQFETIV